MKSSESHSWQLLVSRWKRRFFSRPQALLSGMAIGLVVLIGWWSWQTWLSHLDLRLSWHKASTAVGNFLDPTTVLAQTNGRTNFLLLGVGGAGHEAPDLTDSMMFVSMDLQTGEVVLVSLPRDLWIPSIRAKLNTSYYYGKQRAGESGGWLLAKTSVEEVIDQPVHYVVLIDFNGFVEFINQLGGIEVEVQRSFDDYKYPIPGKETAQPDSARYEHLHFDAGRQQMDGQKALKFVRSRNADGEEGSDLARSERQKQVMLAIKDKLLTTNVLLNLETLKGLKTTLGDSVRSDIDEPLYPALARVGLNFRSEKLRSAALSVELDETLVATSSALLVHPPVSAKQDFQWVLVPRENGFSNIQKYMRCLLTTQMDSECL